MQFGITLQGWGDTNLANQEKSCASHCFLILIDTLVIHKRTEKQLYCWFIYYGQGLPVAVFPQQTDVTYEMVSAGVLIGHNTPVWEVL